MKLKRLVSAILAVGMALSVLPPIALADSGSNSSFSGGVSNNNVEINFIDGIPDLQADDVKQSATGIYDGTGWTYDTTNATKPVLKINSGFIADFGDVNVKCRIQNSGEIKSGSFDASITNQNSGCISGGRFKGYIANWGTISGGVFQEGSTDSPGIIEGGLFYNISQMQGTFKGGIYKTKPNTSNNLYKLTAPDCTICEEWLDSAYVVVSDSAAYPQHIKLTFNNPDKFTSWDLSESGLDESDVTINKNVIEFNMPQHDVKISVKKISSDLVLNDDGIPESMGSTSDGWRYVNGILTFYDGYQAKLGDADINCPVVNYGEIVSGHYNKKVTNYNIISNGYFNNVVTNEAGATINGGTFKTSVENKGTLNAGVFGQIPTGQVYYILSADSCVINQILNDTAYVIVKSPNYCPELTVESIAGKKFLNWTADGLKIESGKETSNPLVFSAPASPDSDKIILTAIKIKSDVVVGEDGLPTEDGKLYLGSQYDGWSYDINRNRLTIDDYTLDIGDILVNWNIINSGTIKSGQFSGVISNMGTIEDGVYLNTVSNYGVVENGTYAGHFINGTRTTQDVDGNDVYTNGYVKSGVFSRYADFGEQNPSICWVSVNSGTVNGMSVAGIVGKQTVTVKADTGFKCWSVSGDTDFTLTDEQKYNPELTLTLNGEDKGNIILTAQTEEGYYRLNLTDGKAYSATADGAKDQEINAAKPGDTVILEADASLIPDGMVFDRWEVTGDTELTGNFDAKAEKTSFTMPKSEVTLRAMYRMADQPEEPNVLGTVAMVATAGVGAAVVGYTGYMIGTELYLNTVLPEGAAIPNNATELAVLVWTDAGKPVPAAVLAADSTDEQKALTWAVENQLISADKAADASVGRWEVIDAWNKAQEMKH